MKNKNMYIGSPAWIKLEDFGEKINDYFGLHAYLVGSSLHTKSYRDVDVRLIMEDFEYDKYCGGTPEHPSRKWRVICCAFSSLGKEITGLNIDFQIQRRSYVNEHFDEDKIAIGLRKK